MPSRCANKRSIYLRGCAQGRATPRGGTSFPGEVGVGSKANSDGRGGGGGGGLGETVRGETVRGEEDTIGLH